MGHQACIEHPTWLAGPGPQARRGSPEGQRAALWRGLGRAAPGPAHQRQGVQYFNAWGKKLTGSVNQTKRTFTGQYLDDTGLLFYHARYCDPGMGRFVSADSMVPGNASGGMDGIAYKPLTVDVHEPSFVSAVNRENQVGPWYTLSDQERWQVGVPWGPANPQALNRYSSVLNNPLKWTDPGGHFNDSDPCRKGCGGYAPPIPGPLTGAGRLPQAAVDAGTVTIGGVLLANPPQTSQQGTIVNEAKETKKSRKERASDIPSWAKGKNPAGDTPSEKAENAMNEQYGRGNWKNNTQRQKEYRKLQKHYSRTRDEK